MAERVSSCVEAWRNLTRDPWILEVVEGYQLELESHQNQPTCSNTVRANEQNTTDACRGGSTNPPAEDGNRGSASIPGPVCEPNFCNSQEGRFSPPSVQSETIEPVHQEGAFQDGGYDDSERIGAEARLVLHNRSERCVSLGSNSQRSQEVPQVYMGGEDLSVHMSSLWPLQFPKGIHETFKASDGSPPETGPQVSDLFGQPPLDGPGKGVFDAQDNTGSGATTKPGFHGKPRKVSTFTNSRDYLFGIHSRFKGNAVPSAPGE